MLLNPAAGSKGGSLVGTIEAFAEEQAAELIVWQKPDGAPDIFQALKDHPARQIIAIGGDGTINLAASAAVVSKKHWALCPLARATGLPAT